jgi:cation-transporting P-type ATPase E
MEPAGLTEQEAHARRARGLGNRIPPATGRSYRQIVRENVLTFVNGVIFALGLTLLILGQWGDALVSVAVVGLNVLVGLVQEVRAKRVLDRIALLTRPTARVIRDSRSREIDPAEIVVGDLLAIGPGDQMLVDGILTSDGRIEVDESLLTGESEPVAKAAGDELYSGSFCVSGTAIYQAMKVGDDCLAHRMTTGARAFRRVYTPLQRQINIVVRVILFVAGSFGLILVGSAIVDRLPPVEVVRMAIVVIGLVPNGLFLAITAAYALGALRIAGHGALVQQANAIESLSNVDVLCLDKTGTLTSGRLALAEVQPMGIAMADADLLLGGFAASVTAGNATTRAIGTALPGRRLAVRDEIAFASDRRWSGLLVAGWPEPEAFVLGAPEVLRPHLPAERRDDVDAAVERSASTGLRVLLFARCERSEGLRDAAGAPSLPRRLVPVALLLLRDELRSAVKQTLEDFAAAGIALKVISGDHPVTARAVAIQAGVVVAGPVVLGDDLARADADELRRLAGEATVFARVGPHEKERLVGALRESGRYVAMIGDGVNDVPSLKRADLAIAMNGGSQATRAVADLILLDDSFATLPAAFREGQRILQGMQDVLRLFLTRILYMALVIVAVALVDAGFPYTPRQNALVTLFTVGIPAIALAAWARPAPIARERLLPSLLHFVVPAGWSLALVGLASYLLYLVFAGSFPLAQSMLTALSVFGGSALVLFASPPNTGWTGGATVVGGWRPVALVAATVTAFAWVASDETVSVLFDLGPLSGADILLAGSLAIAWATALRWMWRAHLIERVFGFDARTLPATSS